jgi:hypothetical protein
MFERSENIVMYCYRNQLEVLATLTYVSRRARKGAEHAEEILIRLLLCGLFTSAHSAGETLFERSENITPKTENVLPAFKISLPHNLHL